MSQWPKMVCDSPQSPDTFTHQIWKFYLKEYKRYAPDAMQTQETRSEVKVTVTQVRYLTLRHPKIHQHTKFVIPTSNYIRDMLRTRFILKLNQRSRSRSQWQKMVCGTPPFQDASTHQIWDSYLKEYREMHRTRGGTDSAITIVRGVGLHSIALAITRFYLQFALSVLEWERK